MLPKRYLIVTADDFGIGPATSQGILELARRGIVSASVLLVQSPHAEAAVQAWNATGRPMELGWHPCLTLDGPVLPARDVPSLVDAHGRFHPLGTFLNRLVLGKITSGEIESELRAQYERFRELVGHPPTVVNTHHHVQVFPPIDRILAHVLDGRRTLPYVRRVMEPIPTLAHVGGARLKRALLATLGRRQARQLARAGFPGNDWLIGITDPPYVHDPLFFRRWLRRAPGQIVEITCHPGNFDDSLLGRDCTANDGQRERRMREFDLLADASFSADCAAAGFHITAPRHLAEQGLARRIAA